MSFTHVLLVIAYDGTGYLGWQKNKIGPSIEETLENAISTVLQHPVQLQASSRTDRGVHASGQAVTFKTHKRIENFPRLAWNIHSLLPRTLTVISAQEVPAAFHPTLDTLAKEYHYSICTGRVQIPQHRLYSWHYPYSLDLEKMRAAAGLLIGTHDFKSFANTKKNEHYASTIRTLETIELVDLGDQRIRIEIKGDHFLYKMVRNLVGTLVEIGRHQRKIENMRDLLACPNRIAAGITAPAHGLFLHRIFFVASNFEKKLK